MLHFHILVKALYQGSNLTVARSPLATENDNGQLKTTTQNDNGQRKTHSKVARLATILFFIFLFFKSIVKYSGN